MLSTKNMFSTEQGLPNKYGVCTKCGACTKYSITVVQCTVHVPSMVCIRSMVPHVRSMVYMYDVHVCTEYCYLLIVHFSM